MDKLIFTLFCIFVSTTQASNRQRDVIYGISIRTISTAGVIAPATGNLVLFEERRAGFHRPRLVDTSAVTSSVGSAILDSHGPDFRERNAFCVHLDHAYCFAFKNLDSLAPHIMRPRGFMQLPASNSKYDCQALTTPFLNQQNIGLIDVTCREKY